MTMTWSTYMRLGSAAAAALLLLAAVPACSKSGEPPAAQPSGAESSSAPAPGVGDKVAEPSAAAPAPTGEAGAEDGTGDTVVFEVTGTGSATTIDLVPAPPEERLYDVPLPWSSTITIAPDVTQLQVVAVGSGATNPGCKITLNGEVVAEEAEGGDAQCVFDR